MEVRNKSGADQRSGKKVRADSLQNDLIPAFLYSCSLRISLLSSNSTAGREEVMTTTHTYTHHKWFTS